MIENMNTLLGIHPMNDSKLGINSDVASKIAVF